MKTMKLVLIILLTYLVRPTEAPSKRLAGQSLIETESARLQLGTGWKGEAFPRIPGHLLWSVVIPPFIVMDGKLHRLSEAGAAVAERREKINGKTTELLLSVTEFVVPSPVKTEAAAEQVGYMLVHVVASMNAAMIAHVIGEGYVPSIKRIIVNYEVRRTQAAMPNVLQYSMVLVIQRRAGLQEKWVVGWLAAHWRSNRIVVMILSEASASSNLQPCERIWNDVLASFEWKQDAFPRSQ